MATPLPTASPTPSSSPTASPSPSPSASAAPSPTPTLAPPVPDFQPVALIGTGKKTVKLDIPKGSAALATVTFKGVKRFVVTAVAADGRRNELLVDRTGSYTGTVLFDVGVDADALSVQATGAWNIVIKPVANARTWDGASVLKGTGDDVVQPVPSRGGSVTIAYTGAGAFSVWSYSEAGSTRLVSASGKVSSKVPLPVGTFLIVVRATGSWTIRPSS
jgi:hypothetical protein